MIILFIKKDNCRAKHKPASCSLQNILGHVGNDLLLKMLIGDHEMSLEIVTDF
jgi:hypothetical protein